MHQKRLDAQAIQNMEQRHRTAFINTLSGFKSINLCGTIDSEGRYNLAPFSSVVHLGANPALMGFIMRPITVSRHTYENIVATGYYTLNHLSSDIYKQGHQCAARYDREQSEFEQVGLKPKLGDLHPAPYVEESPIQIGLQFESSIPIPINGTLLMIGRIIEVFFPEQAMGADGFLDLEMAGSITCSGLEAYHQTQKLGRLSYAKPDQALSELAFPAASHSNKD
ncbi:MAG: flavin reductase [Bacteroidota bacterium]